MSEGSSSPIATAVPSKNASKASLEKTRMESIDEKLDYTSEKALDTATHPNHDRDVEKAALASTAVQLGDEKVTVGANEGAVANGSEKSTISLRQERIYMAVLCWCMFLTGWNSATLGPLLPTIQKHYHVNYAIVSMIFVSTCCGTIPGSVASGYLTDRLGFGKLIALGAFLQLGTYSVLAAAPPFPVFCIIYMLNGLAGALQTASCNIFVTGMAPENRPSNLGIMHAMFGTGALVAPLVATQFAQQRHWSFHYLTSLGFAAVNNVLVIVVFKWKRQEQLIPEAASRRAANAPDAESSNGGNKLLQIWRLPTVHFMSLFLFLYVGSEITTGGWIFTYLLNYRGGGPSAGYVSSGFFGGLTLGRVALLQVNRKIGPERVIYIYTVLSIALELTIWFVPNLIENAVAVSFVGVFLGPFYPILLGVAARKLPKRLLAGSIGWMSACGQVGSAMFPFVTGAIASKHGVQVLQPLLVAMMSALLLLWFLAMRSKVPGGP
ncbi:hypothetical protein FRB94_012780 [Tulasnella sp. JGI-2019a]|nr:hypothetical protein FRB94_012780 [Tulasnella sp. JGI-2019a]KAG9018493.1 hypothetical protein FRB93_000196 [Tulasnella sp. JGI-2019a]